jgi:hypothetical protein
MTLVFLYLLWQNVFWAFIDRQSISGEIVTFAFLNIFFSTIFCRIVLDMALVILYINFV